MYDTLNPDTRAIPYTNDPVLYIQTATKGWTRNYNAETCLVYRMSKHKLFLEFSSIQCYSCKVDNTTTVITRLCSVSRLSVLLLESLRYFRTFIPRGYYENYIGIILLDLRTNVLLLIPSDGTTEHLWGSEQVQTLLWSSVLLEGNLLVSIIKRTIKW